MKLLDELRAAIRVRHYSKAWLAGRGQTT
jgi:hypothetical protein